MLEIRALYRIVNEMKETYKMTWPQFDALRTAVDKALDEAERLGRAGLASDLRDLLFEDAENAVVVKDTDPEPSSFERSELR